MSTPDPYSALSRDDLVQMILEQQRQIAELRAEWEQLRRAGNRQAAPLATGKRKAQPKPPGRKRGQGTFRYREAPAPAEITEPPVEVPVTQLSCPKCGGDLVEEGIEGTYRTEMPAPPQPQVTQYSIHVCRCVECGRQVRGEHPEGAPDQYGASAHRVGERALATAHALHDGVGVPVRKVAAIMAMMAGIRVTQSALTHDAQRRAVSGRCIVSCGHACRKRRQYIPMTRGGGWGGSPPS